MYAMMEDYVIQAYYANLCWRHMLEKRKRDLNHFESC